MNRLYGIIYADRSNGKETVRYFKNIAKRESFETRLKMSSQKRVVGYIDEIGGDLFMTPAAC